LKLRWALITLVMSKLAGPQIIVNMNFGTWKYGRTLDAKFCPDMVHWASCSYWSMNRLSSSMTTSWKFFILGL
jgi:hypothetical protein